MPTGSDCALSSPRSAPPASATRAVIAAST
jgi:hypothetical protein